MPIGPKGEKRPANVIENAVHMCKVATGLIEEEYVNLDRQKGGLKGGPARAKALSAKRRKEIAKTAAAARTAKRGTSPC